MKDWLSTVASIIVAGMIFTGIFVGFIVWSKSKVMMIMTIQEVEE